MHLSRELVTQFQKTHKEKFGESISEGEARRDLSSLASLLKIVIGGRKERK